MENKYLIQKMENTRNDFPILNEEINGEQLVYLDNAATTQKPKQVIQSLVNYYEHQNSNIHRGVHTLGNRATIAYEQARRVVQRFINAEKEEEIIFTGGTTESLNWIATGWLKRYLKSTDIILTTRAEHHANLIPWQELIKQTGARLEFIPLTETGNVDVKTVKQMLTPNHRFLAINHVSNVLGIENPIKELSQLMHANEGYIIVDGAQSIPHMPVDVKALDVDFYAFSAHKMIAPTGIGVLYGKKNLLKQMTPQLLGGEMITRVGDYESEWADLPYRLEGGTRHIAGAIGLAHAINYLNQVGMNNILTYEKLLVDYIYPRLKAIEGVTLYGGQKNRSSALFTFNIDGIHPHDVATVFDEMGIAVRAGHHCAQPLMRLLNTPSTVRASFYFYNTFAEADRFLTGIEEVKEFFKGGII
ncbi:aminotransferase class V-fold PLP-dependent enzyme [Atopobacter phocae]|uniref:aminotransferase class V-fold PLP-dependent enzyme n=1 Tax=Atopobacter phocae TaxID=136492 RepID=UPI0004B4E09D|nr:SufS family cysteine desulfurase [Atopobacter phocae]